LKLSECGGFPPRGAAARAACVSEADLWQNWELRSLLEVLWTAGGGGRFLVWPEQAYLAGFG